MCHWAQVRDPLQFSSSREVLCLSLGPCVLTLHQTGWRVPRFIISPWTRGGNVFTEFADHTSDIQFVEEWAAANGYKGVYAKSLTPWRRQHMSNLVNAFDFNNVRSTRMESPITT